MVQHYGKKFDLTEGSVLTTESKNSHESEHCRLVVSPLEKVNLSVVHGLCIKPVPDPKITLSLSKSYINELNATSLGHTCIESKVGDKFHLEAFGDNALSLLPHRTNINAISDVLSNT